EPDLSLSGARRLDGAAQRPGARRAGALRAGARASAASRTVVRAPTPEPVRAAPDGSRPPRGAAAPARHAPVLLAHRGAELRTDATARARLARPRRDGVGRALRWAPRLRGAAPQHVRRTRDGPLRRRHGPHPPPRNRAARSADRERCAPRAAVAQHLPAAGLTAAPPRSTTN